MIAAALAPLRALWGRSRRRCAQALEVAAPALACAWRARRERQRRKLELARLRATYEEGVRQGGLRRGIVPRAVHHELTSRCNLSCGMCYQTDWRAASPRLELDVEALHEIHARLLPRRAVLVGSEVLLHPRFFEIADELASSGCELHLLTNGTLIDEARAPRLLALRSLRAVILSIDGPREVHDAIRGGKAAFDRAIRGVELLRKQVELALHCVLQPANLASAHEVLDIAHAHGVRSVHYGFLYAYTAAEVEATHALLERELGWKRDEVELAITTGDGLGFGVAELRACIERIEARARELGLHASFTPPEFREHLEAYVDGTLHVGRRLACRDLLEPDDLRIDPRGKLVPCAVIKKDLGDARSCDPAQLANSAERRAFAKLVHEQNLLPICRRCCRATVLPER
ncbi:MAG: radical SAM protein [Planctomycetes bacterium]|nr:radical SAM protein [Planctomycetota bacterium]